MNEKDFAGFTVPSPLGSVLFYFASPGVCLTQPKEITLGSMSSGLLFLEGLQPGPFHRPDLGFFKRMDSCYYPKTPLEGVKHGFSEKSINFSPFQGPKRTASRFFAREWNHLKVAKVVPFPSTEPVSTSRGGSVLGNGALFRP
ncbi:MAG: hypothetical protein QNK37_16715 [Acidobacteriota bacterium]|nr:hypothetical protein [Acidobacteriota bacterium]